jgi:hypothetical protein
VVEAAQVPEAELLLLVRLRRLGLHLLLHLPPWSSLLLEGRQWPAPPAGIPAAWPGVIK